jgi:predicted extracellular nuclease
MKFILFITLLSLSILVYGQKSVQEFTVLFYNVENLFDTEDEPDKKDEEFTPGSDKAWDQDKYEKKLKDIARVLSSVDSTDLPEIIGLCEIENRKVLEELVNIRSLRKGNYSIVHSESPDNRGIDVALLYRADEFSVHESESIPVIFPFDSSMTTRDILYVTGKEKDGESFHFFVNHWSSRNQGEKETEPKRIYAAVTLRKEIDELMNRDPDAKILIMGDFNDEPTNHSIFEMLMANNKRKNASERELYNLMYDLHNVDNAGTYFYSGNWNMLDQLIISQSLLRDKTGYHTGFNSGKILKQQWMLYHDQQFDEYVPNKTYGGPEYYGGISDHLPVYVTLVKE